MNGNERGDLTHCWVQMDGEELEQGDLLPDCYYPVTFNPNPSSSPIRTDLTQSSLIIVTQSCDIVGGRMLPQIALCRIFNVDKMQSEYEKYREKGFWDNVKRGRTQGLYLLQCPGDPDNKEQALVVDFRQIISLPSDYIIQRTREIGNRWRLTPPQREHFSQAFGVYFMRVALPETLPDFKGYPKPTA